MGWGGGGKCGRWRGVWGGGLRVAGNRARQFADLKVQGSHSLKSTPLGSVLQLTPQVWPWAGTGHFQPPCDAAVAWDQVWEPPSSEAWEQPSGWRESAEVRAWTGFFLLALLPPSGNFKTAATRVTHAWLKWMRFIQTQVLKQVAILMLCIYFLFLLISLLWVCVFMCQRIFESQFFLSTLWGLGILLRSWGLVAKYLHLLKHLSSLSLLLFLWSSFLLFIFIIINCHYYFTETMI